MAVSMEFLKAVPALSELNGAELAKAAASIETRTLKKGATVFFKGEAVHGLHIVKAGKVAVRLKSPKEKEPKTLAELGPGEIFGETSILEDSLAGANIQAVEDGTEVWVVPQETFLALMAERPELRQKFEAVAASRKAPPQG